MTSKQNQMISICGSHLSMLLCRNDTGFLNAKVLPWTLCRLVLPSSIIMSVQRTCKPLGVDAEDDQSEQENCVLQVGIGRGNPWVHRCQPLPLPTSTHTPVPMHCTLGYRGTDPSWVYPGVCLIIISTSTTIMHVHIISTTHGAVVIVIWPWMCWC